MLGPPIPQTLAFPTCNDGFRTIRSRTERTALCLLSLDYV